MVQMKTFCRGQYKKQVEVIVVLVEVEREHF